MVNSVTSRTRVGSHRGRRFSCTRAENVEPRPSCSVDKSNEPHQTRHQLRDQRTSRSFGIAARPLLVAVSDCEWFCVAAKMYLVGQRPCSACGCAQRLCCQLTSHTLVHGRTSPLYSGSHYYYLFLSSTPVSKDHLSNRDAAVSASYVSF